MFWPALYQFSIRSAVMLYLSSKPSFFQFGVVGHLSVSFIRYSIVLAIMQSSFSIPIFRGSVKPLFPTVGCFRNVLSTGGISFFSWLTEPVQNFKTLQWASYFTLMLPSILSSLILTANFLIVNNSSVIRQKGESRNRSKKKVKQSKFPKKWTFLTPWYAHVRVRIKG